MERVSTRTVPAPNRFRFWQDAVCAYYPSVEISADRRDFAGTIATRMIGPMRATEVSSGAQHVRRSARQIASAREDILQLNFQITGEGFLRQDGRECVTPPGQFVLYDSTRPYELRFRGPFKQISVKLPRTPFRARYGSLDAFTARAIDGTAGPGRYLFAFVRQVVGDDAAEGPLAQRLHDHFGDLLMTALTEVPGVERSAARPGRAATLLRAKTYILSNLRDPNLSTETIAAALGLSLRSLHCLFEQEQTTLWRWVQMSRLTRCRVDLEDPASASRSIAEIAYSWGFSDPANFSRLFRRQFGLSPRECRNG